MKGLSGLCVGTNVVVVVVVVVVDVVEVVVVVFAGGVCLPLADPAGDVNAIAATASAATAAVPVHTLSFTAPPSYEMVREI